MRKLADWRRGLIAAAAATAIAGTAGVAWADEDGDERARKTIGAGQPSEALPPPSSDHDPRPPAPRGAGFELPGVTEQAGVGGTQAYARAGVLELGGSAGFGAAPDYSRFELSPSIGFFVTDNVELSLLTAFNYFSVGEVDGRDGTSATELRAMIEPSYHMALSNAFFLFGGLGAGVNYVTGHSAGFAWQPRVGANLMVGRSGVLTPAFSMTYSTVEALRTEAGTLLAVQTSYGLNIGYTVMW